MFNNVPYSYGGETGKKSVTVKVPDNTTWDNIISAYNDNNTTANNWGNAFRGGGWNEGYLGYTVNSYLNLTIEKETP
jgi:hypothetical protein